MQDWLAARALVSPDHIALVINGQRWSYSELDAQVNDLCGRLTTFSQQGPNSGIENSFVAALLPNSLEYVCLIHALARLGLTLIPLNTRLTKPELAWQLDQTTCNLLICSRETEETAAALAIPSRTLLSFHPTVSPAVRSLADFVPDSQFQPAPFSLDAYQAIIFTSGTSGRPKGAMLTYANHFWSATASAFRLGTLPEDRWLNCLPLYHVGGLAIVLRCCLYGTTAVLHDGFDVTAFNKSLDNDKISLVSLVPTLLHRLLQSREPGSWPESLRLVLLGGAAATPELITRCHAAGVPVATTYGLTEAASQVATMLPEDVRRKPGSVGKPLMFTSVRIVNEKGHDRPAGAYGEIVVTGPTVMASYFQQPSAFSLQPSAFATGDVGYLDEDGDLWVAARRSDLIVSGGENVYPAEVEAVIRGHTAVAAVCVVGVPSVEWGQQVAALVVLQKGSDLTAGELLDFCRARLAGYKRPRLVRFVDNLPQTASGKIHRRAVVDWLTAEIDSLGIQGSGKS